MLSIVKQLERGILVCPRTGVPLKQCGQELMTEDGRYHYPIRGNAPILFAEEATQKQYLEEQAGSMAEKYAESARAGRFRRVRDCLTSIAAYDYRSADSRAAFSEVFDQQTNDSLCLAIGGGPGRHHDSLVNLNIARFPNVDVVADAYRLPYANNSVEAIYCEAVLEHLEHPNEAVAEMFRVLKPGGRVFAATPFLQWFHAFPNHFQNFTLEGHKRLFTRHGFVIDRCGTCVGPTFALMVLANCYAKLYLPFLIRQVCGAALRLLRIMLCPIDMLINRHAQSHILASTTFVLATKPTQT